MFNSLTTSWRSTVFGILGGLSTMAVQVMAVLDNDPATSFSWAAFSAGLGLLGIGAFARDSNVSSETAGAK